MAKLNRQHKIILLVVLGLLATVSGYAYGQFHNHNYNYVAPNDDRIIDGVQVGPMAVGGLSLEEAADKLISWSQTALSQVVRFNYEGKVWERTLADLGIEINWKAALEEASKAGKQGNFWQRYSLWATAKEEGYQILVPYKFDEARTASIIATMTDELTIEPVEATRTINAQNEVIISAEKPGLRIDSQKAARELQAQLGSGPTEPMNKKLNVALRKTEIPPQVTRADLEKQRINSLLASYTTSFATSSANRSYNIKVAAEAIDNHLLAPGETFSFNQVVGPRSQEAGYKEALVIVKNEMVPGLGGGVCQVSTTLYNAVLRANLLVVERSNHSLPVSYVPVGWDATVTYGGIDFKFRNPYEGYLLLKTQIKGKNLTVQIFGDEQYRKEVELSSRIIARIEPRVITRPNPDLYEGKEIVEQQGKAGIKVQVYRIFKQAGQVINQELISTDLYNPINKIVQIGTKKNTEDLVEKIPDQPTETVTDLIPETRAGAGKVDTLNPPSSTTGTESPTTRDMADSPETPPSLERE
ncbi:MAG: hypothetical protein GX295_09365 [Syntrophomonadaceae bacterium]|nr:hypothetical protein [Syntrophomonadaceae bacterium]